MCGITGYWMRDGRPVAPQDLERFTHSLAHRGPDGSGTHIDENAGIGLGHRRLSIFDRTDRGRQPMSFGMGRYWITYNGEIYNFVELREELEDGGYRFQTDTDTEVVVASYVAWGEACQQRFNGMWAFAVWDALDRVLFLSRDRFGIKPLHYAFDQRHFIFASEMKAFAYLPFFRAEMNYPMLKRTLDNPLSIEGTEDCLLKGVKRVPAGCSLKLGTGGEPEISRWWNTLDHLAPPPRGREGQIERFRELFFDSCRLRMRSDTPIATALSGGLDSASVVASMAHVMRGSNGQMRVPEDWQRAFVGVYGGTAYDESPYARAVVDDVACRGVYKQVTVSEFADRIDDIIYHLEDMYYEIPFGPWVIYREMRREGVVVSLDGHGGDELLGGYHFYLPLAMADAMRPKLHPIKILRLRRCLRGMFADDARPALPTVRQMLRMKGVPFDTSWYGRLSDDLERLRGLDVVTQGLYIDTHYRTLPTILRNFDRISMAHGVEVRTPFLDWRLVSYCFSLSGEYKIGNGCTKRMLRMGMKGLMPEGIRNRRQKLGFGHPHSAWVKGPLRQWVLETVNSKVFLDSNVFDGRELSRRIEGACKRDQWHETGDVERYILAAKLPGLLERGPAETS